MEDKISHLQMIQSIIDRMGKNSFSLKGWSVGIMIAIYAFAGQNYNKAVIVTLIPLIIFWILDSSYYLMLERKYRRLYEFIRNIFSKTIWPFYVACIMVTIIIYFFKF